TCALPILQDYISLEALRLGKEVSFEIHNAENLPLDLVFIPPLLLQPLVENSLWHGISKHPHAGIIQLFVQPEADALILILRDNGGGKRESIRLAHKSYSMGMSLVQNRLEHFSNPKSSDT